MIKVLEQIRDLCDEEIYKQVNEKIVDEFIIEGNRDLESNSIYDKNGLSKPTKYGGVRIKKVDELIESWKNSRDPKKRQIGKQQAKYICFDNYQIKKDSMMHYQVKSNQSRLWFVSANGIMLDSFFLMREKYYNRYTGEKVYKTPNWNIKKLSDWVKPSRIFVTDAQGKIAPIEDHMVASYANYSHITHRYYKSKFFDKIPEAVEKYMMAKYDNLDLNL